MRISDWSSDLCSSDLDLVVIFRHRRVGRADRRRRFLQLLRGGMGGDPQPRKGDARGQGLFETQGERGNLQRWGPLRGRFVSAYRTALRAPQSFTASL